MDGQKNNEEDNVDNVDVNMEVEWAEALNITFDAMEDTKELMERRRVDAGRCIQ